MTSRREERHLAWVAIVIRLMALLIATFGPFGTYTVLLASTGGLEALRLLELVFMPSMIFGVVGVILFLASRPLARLVVYGI